MAAVDYSINYDDKRLTAVKNDESAALSDLEKTYSGMINQSDKYYQQQIDASKDWANKQQELQQQQTDFAIKEIEQNKAQTKKDYIKEQSGAYVDWQKQSDPYGVNAEQRAAQGLEGSGYSESAQVSMYNTYQNRVTAAREAYTLAVQNYNNMITKARLENNSVLAEIAYKALQQQLELSLQGFQYKNQLILEKADKKTALQANYWARYQDVINQINTENSLAEQVRQYNENLALQKEQLQLQKDQFAWQKSQAKKSSSGGSGGSSSSKSSGGTISKGSSSSSNGSSVSNKTNGSESVDAYTVLNAMIKSGATKDKVANEISLALRNGAITQAEATELRSIFTPRGHQY